VELAVSETEAKKGKCIECLACELASFEHGCMALRIDLPMPEVEAAHGRLKDGGSMPPLPPAPGEAE
jgi:hypothetical protein